MPFLPRSTPIRVVALFARDLTIPIALTLSIGFFVYNTIHFSGPAYTGSDEVAYLAKAAFLAGKPVDYASSWFAGYSVFLVPAFTLFASPHHIWVAVLATNALLWFGSFVLLGRFLREVQGPVGVLSHSDLNVAMLASCLYPGWFVLSGYAFPNSAFVFVFMVAVVTLPVRSVVKPSRVIAHCTAVVYLCWIHPAGYAVLAISIVFLLVVGRRNHHLLHASLGSSVMIALVFVVGPTIEKTINDAMTPAGFGYPTHYGSHITGQLTDVFSPTHLIGLAKQLLTVSSAVIIASFGLVIVAGLSAFRSLTSKKLRPEAANTELFCFLSLVGVIGITSLSLYSPARFTMQLDHWIFLRYAEGVLLPVLGIGTLALLRASKKDRLIVGGLSLLVITSAAVLLQHDLNVRGTTSRVDNHFVMSAGFWPFNVDPTIKFSDWLDTTPATAMSYPNFVRWYVIGALGMTVVAALKHRALVPTLVLMLLCAPRIQTNWHQWLAKEYSPIPEVAQDRLEEHDRTSCVGFMTTSDMSLAYPEEYLRLTYWMVGMNLRRQLVTSNSPGCPTWIIPPGSPPQDGSAVIANFTDGFLLVRP